MRTPDKAKPATARSSEPVSKIVLPDNVSIAPSPISLQVARLKRLYAVNAATAEALAPLAFGVTS